MNLPPLNQTLRTPLIGSLTASAGWIVVVLASRIEQLRQERHRDRFAHYSARLRSRRGGMRLSVCGSMTAEFLSTAKSARTISAQMRAWRAGRGGSAVEHAISIMAMLMVA
jgi:hypothetical protein